MPATQVKLNQLKQSSATTGQVIAWDATNGWIPTTISSGGSSSGTSGTIQYSNGSGGFSGDPSNLFWNSTTKSLQITGTSSAYAGVFSGDGGGINISQATNLTATFTGVNISSNNTQTIRINVANTNGASTTAHTALQLRSQLGDPYILFSPTNSEPGAVVAGIDNSSTGDIFYISRGSDPSTLTGPQFKLDGANDSLSLRSSTSAAYLQVVGSNSNISATGIINLSAASTTALSLDNTKVSIAGPLLEAEGNATFKLLNNQSFLTTYSNASSAISISDLYASASLYSRDSSNYLSVSNTGIVATSPTGFTINNTAGTGSTSLKSATGTFSNTFTLPNTTGSSGQVLSTDGTGVLSWVDQGSDSVISPTQLSADQNNYNPTGFSTATVVRIDGDNQMRIITGLVAPVSGTSFRKVTFINVGANTILFTSQDTDSTAANRFDIDQKLFGLYPDDSVTFIYDNTSDRWRIHSVSQSTFNCRHRFLERNQLNPSTVYHFQNLISSGNSQVGTNNDGNSSESTNNYYLSASALNGYGSFVSSIAIFRTNLSSSSRILNAFILNTRIRIDTNLSDATNRYIVKAGLFSTISDVYSATPVGMYFSYSDNESSGQWLGRIRNSTGSVTDIGTVAVAANTTYKLEMVVLPTRQVMFYVDDVLYGKAANTNITTGTFYLGSSILKTVGATARGVYLDRFAGLTILR